MHLAEVILAEFIPSCLTNIVAEFIKLDYLPTEHATAIASEFFPKGIAYIIGNYARSTDLEVADHIRWECMDMRVYVNYNDEYVTLSLDLIKKLPRTDPNCGLYLMMTDNGRRINELDHHSYTAYVSVAANSYSHPLDMWALPKLDLYSHIISNTTPLYQESYFLPFINMFHARLKHVIQHGE
jgi:hypothetical protein